MDISCDNVLNLSMTDSSTDAAINHLVVCVGVPAFVAVLALATFICVIGVCCVCRQKRKKKKGMVVQQMQGSDNHLEMNTSVNLATGQLNLQEPMVSTASRNLSASVSKNIYGEDTIEATKPYVTKTTVTVHLEKGAEPQAAKAPPIASSLEQTTSIASVQNSTALLINSSKAATLQLTRVDQKGPSSKRCVQSPQVKRRHSYEDVRAKETSPQESEEGPMYDDVLSTLEIRAGIQTHKYHVLSDPDEEQSDLLSDLRYEETMGSENRDGEISFSAKESSASVICTPQRKKHEYEKVCQVPTDKKEASGNTHDQYHVLATQMDMNPLQGGIVQEDPAESPMEDNYSTARVHRLVPVGKPIGPLSTDHLYQALDEPGSRRRRREDYDRVQMRHNTFTGSCDALRRSSDQLVRTYSTTAQSLEKLDPMYDEPFKPRQRSSSVSRVDIYNVDSLFDDPKYVSKRSALFEDPPFGRWAVEDPEAPERHVSFTVQSQQGVEGSPVKKSGVRQAALRKTK